MPTSRREPFAGSLGAVFAFIAVDWMEAREPASGRGEDELVVLTQLGAAREPWIGRVIEISRDLADSLDPATTTRGPRVIS